MIRNSRNSRSDPSFSSSLAQYAATKGRVKASAYEPTPAGELSVLRNESRTEDQIWRWGDAHPGSTKGKPAKARGELRAEAFLRQDLEIDADDSPPGHANVVGWPALREARKVIATVLAEQARLVVRED